MMMMIDLLASLIFHFNVPLGKAVGQIIAEHEIHECERLMWVAKSNASSHHQGISSTDAKQVLQLHRYR